MLFTINSWEDLKPHYDKLLNTEIKSVTDLENLILQFSELLSIFSEQNARAYINMTCHTDNQEFIKLHEKFSSEIGPKVDVACNQVQKKITQSVVFDKLPADRYQQLKKSFKRDLELFREENVALDAELAKLSSKYGQLAGGLSAKIGGVDLPLPQASVLLESSDRNKREEAWLAIANARINKKTAHNDIFNEMIKLRHQIALNAGYTNFRDYQHDSMHRFDYSVNDVLAFHRTIEKHVLPLVRVLRENHQKKLKLGINDYRPWDSAGKPENETPLKPFVKADDLLEKSFQIFSQIRPEFGQNLKTMKAAKLFDLESRKAKAPGGYNYPLEATGMPFIFMNAAGTHRDVVTLMHEGGHAMHTFLTNKEPLVQYRQCPSEVAETASMSMELMTSPFWHVFYNKEDHIRARKEHLEDILSTFTWVAVVDSFQHWIYTNPNHSVEDREQSFAQIFKKFSTGIINWAGYENHHNNLWQKQLHIFEVPFYYIEYAIAQLGALQIYRNFIQNPKKAVDDYMKGLRLGSSKPIHEVWAAMNIKFDFSANNLKELMGFVTKELEKLNAYVIL